MVNLSVHSPYLVYHPGSMFPPFLFVCYTSFVFTHRQLLIRTLYVNYFVLVPENDLDKTSRGQSQLLARVRDQRDLLLFSWDF
jgi:hypothetical protein